MENWEEGIFEPDTDISLETEQGLFVHLYMKMDDIYFTVGDPLHEGWTEDYQDSESGYVGTYLVRGNEVKKILNKGLAECLLQAMGPEDSCDFMMSELEGFELDIEGGTSWRSQMDYDFKNSNPREALNAWEAQAFSLLTTKGFPISFKGITELMNDSDVPSDCSKAVRIVFWGRVWRQAKTKEEVTTAWNHILDAVKNSNFQGIADYADGKIAASFESKETDEMTMPVLERIAELKMEGLDQLQVTERGFKKETVLKVFNEAN